MADLKVSELISANIVQKNDLLYVVQDGVSKNANAATLFASIFDPTLDGNIVIGGNVQIITTSDSVDVTKARTEFIGGQSANSSSILSGAILPASIFFYTPGVSASGVGMTFVDGAPFSQTINVTYANGKIKLNGYFPNDWIGTGVNKPFPNGFKFVKGSTYTFVVSDPTNTGNIMSLSTSIDGTNSLGAEYTANVVRVGTPGFSGSSFTFTPANVTVDPGGLNQVDIPQGEEGQLKILTMRETAGGSFSLSGNIINNINIVFRRAGESALMLYSGNAWAVLGATPGFQTTFSGTSDDVPEGSKLYFTNARARAAISAGDQTILYNPITGTIKANVALFAGGNINISALATTDDIAEGPSASANLDLGRAYFTNARAVAAVTASLATISSAAFGNVANVLYVAKNGNDANPGNSLEKPLANIHAALQRIGNNSNTTVKVMSGTYTLYGNPVNIPSRTALVGDNLRTTHVFPQNPTSDMFYVNNGSYVTGFTFRGHQSPSAVFSYNPNGSAGFIVTSPYIQNCSSITTTGTGMRVDGNYVSGLRSMVCDSYTQTNEGGIGIHMLNRGYTQLVSVFTICCNIGILCENGGFCSITNSNTSFGTYGLVSRGVSPTLYSGKIVTHAADGNVSNVLLSNLSIKPNYGDAVLIANFNQAKCSRDTGLIVDSILFDMVYNGNTESKFSGLQYFAQSESAIPGQQTETIAAINHARNLATNVILNTIVSPTYQASNTQVTVAPSPGDAVAVGRINTEFYTITDIIANGTVGVTDLIIPNKYPANTTAAINHAANLLQLNKNFIASEVIGYLSNVYPALVYSNAKCFRDVGYILDSITFDLRHDGNKQAITSGVYYYNHNAAVSQINNQAVQTGAAYTYIKDLIDNVISANTTGYVVLNTVGLTQNTTAAPAGVSNATIITNIRNNIDYLVDIIENGPSYAGNVKTPIGLTPFTHLDVDYAAKLIYANRDFIKAEVLEYVNVNWATISNGAGTFYTVNASTPLVANTSLVTLLETPTEIFLANSRVSFHQPSYISASSHTFEYCGSGDVLATALPYAGGVPIQENEIVEQAGGLVYFTSTDHLGDFRIGNNFTINRVDGTITGRTFNKALFAALTPYILAIEG